VVRSKKLSPPPATESACLLQDVQSTPAPAARQLYREASVTYESGYMRNGASCSYYSPTRCACLRFQTNEIMPAFVTLNARAVNVSGRPA